MPSTSITEEKAALRRAVRARLSAMSPEERAESDGILFRRFLALPGLAAADRVLLFCGMGTEPDTARLIPALLDRGQTVMMVASNGMGGMLGSYISGLALDAGASLPMGGANLMLLCCIALGCAATALAAVALALRKKSKRGNL